MALIKCYECEKEISDKAPACPHCAAPGVNSEEFTGWKTKYYATGELWRREYYKDGQRCESHIYYASGGIQSEQHYKSGKEHGKYLMFDENGQETLIENWENGFRHGPFEWYSENGQVRERGTREKGSLHGPYEVYDETGQLTTKGTYKEGLRVGKWIKDGKSESYLFDQYERWAAQPGFGQFIVLILFIALVIWLIWF
jgi:hypothetical protein